MVPNADNSDLLDDYRWLISEAGSNALAQVEQHAGSLTQIVSELRRTLPARLVHLAVELVSLRHRGRHKFRRAAEMLFTARGLEQATGEAIANYKSTRLPGDGLVADLCCGIGGDLMGLARHRQVVAVDKDALLCLLAEVNCRVHGMQPIIKQADVAKFDATEVAAWHIDPDRRPRGSRTTRVALHEPNDAVLQSLLDTNPKGAIKLAPATRIPDCWLEAAELEWIGHQRECKQLMLWFGQLAESASRFKATVVDRNGAVHSLSGQPDSSLDPVPTACRYLYEPHPAVLAARLSGRLLERNQLLSLDPRGEFLTSEHLVQEPLCSIFEVTDVLPVDLRRLNAKIRQQGIGHLEMKKRGVAADLDQLRKRLRLRGNQQATLVLLKIDNQPRAVFAQRVAGV